MNTEWLVRKHYPLVQSLERFTTERWTTDTYTKYLKKGSVVGRIVKFYDDCVIGCYFYQSYKDRLVVRHLTYHYEFDIVLPMILKDLLNRVSTLRKQKLQLLIPEGDLQIQKDLKNLNVMAKVEQGKYVFTLNASHNLGVYDEVY